MEGDWPTWPFHVRLNGGEHCGDRNRRLGNHLPALRGQRRGRPASMSEMLGKRRHPDGTGEYAAAFY